MDSVKKGMIFCTGAARQPQAEVHTMCSMTVRQDAHKDVETDASSW
jgi:hypothetical protein